MTGAIDLHTHTTASDGVLTPSEVVHKANRLGLQVLAITDHDTVSGIAEAMQAAKSLDLEVIPGIEISTEQDEVRAHILGYYVDYQDISFQALLEEFAQARLRRARRIVERLDTLGISLPWEAVAEVSEEGVIGRPHVARAMLDQGHVASVKEAFDRYLSPGQPAFVPRSKVSPAKAIRLIREASGLPVLAHPWCLTFLLEKLVAQGLVGLEVYYRHYDACQVGRLAYLAQELGLISTGGSDFHGIANEHPSLGEVNVPWSCVNELRERRASLMNRSDTHKSQPPIGG